MQITIQRLTLSLVWLTCLAITLASLTVVGANLGWLPTAIKEANATNAEAKDNTTQYLDSECLALYQDSDVDSAPMEIPLLRM